MNYDSCPNLLGWVGSLKLINTKLAKKWDYLLPSSLVSRFLAAIVCLNLVKAILFLRASLSKMTYKTFKQKHDRTLHIFKQKMTERYIFSEINSMVTILLNIISRQYPSSIQTERWYLFCFCWLECQQHGKLKKAKGLVP